MHDAALGPVLAEQLYQASVLQGFPDNQLGKLCHTDTLQGSLQHHVQVRADEPGRVAYFGIVAGLRLQQPAVFVVRRGHVQTGQCRQRIERRRCRQPGGQIRACHQTLGAVPELLDHQPVVFQRRKAHTQRNVDVLGQRIDASVGTFDLDLNLGVLGRETGDGLVEAHRCQSRRTADHHPALRFGFGTQDGLFGSFGLDQHGHAMSVIVTPAFGHRESAGRAVNQAHTQALLEPGNTAAELGLGDPQLATCRREAKALDHLDEIKQIVEIKHPATSFSEPGVCSAVTLASRPGLRNAPGYSAVRNASTGTVNASPASTLDRWAACSSMSCEP